jgi:thioredoxin reductase
MIDDVLIVGGGPAGLSAALALGRARKRVLLCDAGPRRNARAENIHNFVTRDGTPPDDFRGFGRSELARYPNVEIRDEGVLAISGERGAFSAELQMGSVAARRVLLATGMVDVMLPIDGFSELWGHSIFQCPYCHGWEVQDRAWAYLAREEGLGHLLSFAAKLRGWTKNVAVVPFGSFAIPETIRVDLEAAGVRVQAAPIARLVRNQERLTALELEDGSELPCEALFAHPPQKQVTLVQELGVALDEFGFVALDPMRRETSIPGIYAAGDLATRMQGAVLGAAAGTHAATVINAELTMELARAGLI